MANKDSGSSVQFIGDSNMANQDSGSSVQFIDDLYFSALMNEDEESTQIIPISDSKYAEELQFQEALMSSLTISELPNKSLTSTLLVQASIAPQPQSIQVVKKEVGESSHSFCEICMENKEKDETFTNPTCHHSFCSDCIAKHVITKVHETNFRSVICPSFNCKNVIESDTCRPLIPKDVIDRWDDVLCEMLVLDSEKFYCPFKDCSAMMISDDNGGEVVIRECECPVCNRLFCKQCYVAPWHSGIGCEEFQRLGEDEREREDVMVRNLAMKNSWKRCPSCKYYVEKTEGCLHMTCRCGFQYCYACGATWSQYHGGCQ